MRYSAIVGLLLLIIILAKLVFILTENPNISVRRILQYLFPTEAASSSQLPVPLSQQYELIVSDLKTDLKIDSNIDLKSDLSVLANKKTVQPMGMARIDIHPTGKDLYSVSALSLNWNDARVIASIRDLLYSEKSPYVKIEQFLSQLNSARKIDRAVMVSETLSDKFISQTNALVEKLEMLDAQTESPRLHVAIRSYIQALGHIQSSTTKTLKFYRRAREFFDYYF